eukprot:3484414-Lingulodinium_polyedra.AAC.1
MTPLEIALATEATASPWAKRSTLLRKSARHSSFASNAATAKVAASHCASAIATLKRCKAAPTTFGDGLLMVNCSEFGTPRPWRR